MDLLIGHYVGSSAATRKQASRVIRKKQNCGCIWATLAINPYVLTNTESPELLRSTQ